MTSKEEKLHQIYCSIREIEEYDGGGRKVLFEPGVEKQIDDFTAQMKKDLRAAVWNNEMKKFSDAAASLYKLSTRIGDGKTITHNGTTYGKDMLDLFLRGFVYKIREAMGLEVEELEEGCDAPTYVNLYQIKELADTLE